MEVHHHAHEAHGKKIWKSYFRKFLMLFLAEYQSEHKIERDKGKEYTHSFYEDLISDSATFTSLINKYEVKPAALETMGPCYDSLLSGHPPQTCLSTICFISRSFPDMQTAVWWKRSSLSVSNLFF